MIRRFFVLLTLSIMALGIQVQAADLAKSSVLESDVAYLRVGNVGKDLSDEIKVARNGLMSSNSLAGFVVDLRFAGGELPEAVNAAADLLTHEKLPMAVLINDQTHGAALELAQRLHAAHSGLVFGGAGAKIKPDVSVPVDAANEKTFFEDPYSVVLTNEVQQVEGTNNFLPPIDHVSEADLVRARVKDGEDGDVSTTERAKEPAKPFLRDPVLARGVDFIKGLAVLRLSHS